MSAPLTLTTPDGGTTATLTEEPGGLFSIAMSSGGEPVQLTLSAGQLTLLVRWMKAIWWRLISETNP